MEFAEKDAKKFALIFLVVVLAVMTFFVVRPIILSIFGGLILAYVFFPLHKKIAKLVKYPSLSAAIVSIVVLVIILIPIWFLTPLLIQQSFQMFQYSQDLNLQDLLPKILPGVSEQLVTQLDLTITTALSNLTTSILNALVDYIVNFVKIALHFLLVAFVFFFALKDSDKFSEFMSGLSPLNKTQEAKLVKQFRDVTSSIINGQIVAGILQGALAGIGFLVFGVPNALVLTLLSTIFGIIPILGPGIIYLPVGIYMAVTGDPVMAILFLVYNIVIVSSVDNLLRTIIVSRRTQLSQVIVLIGMIGGLFLFGPLGLILGPLVIAYFVTFLRAYKDRTLSSFFSD